MSAIGIVGYGYVGKAFEQMVKDRYEVHVYDELKEGLNSEQIKGRINKCSMAVVCVPTPTNPVDGSCDTSIVEEVISWIEAPLILIKSTIAPTTTDFLCKKYGKRIVFSPEYVGEGKYYMAPPHDFQEEMRKTPFVIVGGNEDDCNAVLDLLVPVLGPSKDYYKCSALEAELIKYMENTYFGVKVTFAQEMYDICQVFGADWYKVWQGWALDPRVDKMHTAVFPHARGFSGKCLPKDMNALVKASVDAGYLPKMIAASLESNADRREDEPVRWR